MHGGWEAGPPMCPVHGTTFPTHFLRPPVCLALCWAGIGPGPGLREPLSGVCVCGVVFGQDRDSVGASKQNPEFSQAVVCEKCHGEGIPGGGRQGKILRWK